MNKKNIIFPNAADTNIAPAASIAPVTSIVPAPSYTPVLSLPQQQKTVLIQEVASAPASITAYDFLTAIQIKDYLGVSRSKAYDIVHELNLELERMGKLTFPGKVPRKLLLDHLYPDAITA